jgi:putative methyltransferase (TIGR04325 family)
MSQEAATVLKIVSDDATIWHNGQTCLLLTTLVGGPDFLGAGTRNETSRPRRPGEGLAKSIELDLSDTSPTALTLLKVCSMPARELPRQTGRGRNIPPAVDSLRQAGRSLGGYRIDHHPLGITQYDAMFARLKLAIRLITPPAMYNLAHAIKQQVSPSVAVRVASPEPEWRVVSRWEDTTAPWTSYTNSLVHEALAEEEKARTTGSFTGMLPDGMSRLWAVAYAYVLTLAQHNGTISILDFGGQLGRYGTIARLALPGVAVSYMVEELPDVCGIGGKVRPWVKFQTKAETIGKFDLVFASGSLQYVEDWRGEMARLARVAGRCVFLSRLQVLDESPTTIVRHRMPTGGHMIGWVFNRSDLLDRAKSLGLRPTQEFYFHDIITDIDGLDTKPAERGYLFLT